MKLKIQGKLLLYILSTALVIYGVAFGYLVTLMIEDDTGSAVRITDEITKKYASLATSELKSDFDVVKTMKNAFNNYPEFTSEEREQIFDPILKEILDNNPHYLAVWYTWELQAIDPNYKLAHGRLQKGYFRIGGVRALTNDTTETKSENIGGVYYNIKTNPREVLLDPYISNYETSNEYTDSMIMASVIVPMFYRNKFAGLVGIDVELTRFRKITENVRPYKGAQSFMVSNNGNFVSVENEKLINKSITEMFPADLVDFDIKGKISKGENINFYTKINGENSYVSISPMNVGNTSTPWSIGIIVPVDFVMKKVVFRTYVTGSVVILGLIIITFIIWIISRKLTIRLTGMTKVIKDLAIGDIHHLKLMTIHSSDEVSDMRITVNSLIMSLNKTADFAMEIGKGNLESEYKPLSEKDKLGNSLLEMRRSLKQAQIDEINRKEEDRKLNWATQGTAVFAEILRTNTDNLQEFSYSIIKELAKYIEVNQGALFVINDTDENDKYIELAAGYAYERRKLLNKRIEFGVGLVGRCIQEAETIYITDIPGEYVNITSGLGESTPNQILIVPLIYNDNVYGVIELASFYEIPKYKIEFIEKVSTSIASTISAVKINVNTAVLLEETKIKSAQMAAQDEEVKQTLELMQDNQDNLLKSLDNLSATYAALKFVSNLVEYDLQGRITDINNTYLNILNLKKEDVIGKYQGSIGTNQQDIVSFNTFWQHLRRGVTRTYTTEYATGERIYELKCFFSPVKDKDGNTYKVISLDQIVKIIK